MAGEEFLSLNAAAAVGAALLFQAAGTNVYDAFSAVMSSPWSTEKFTEDAEADRMAREYVRHALVISGVYAAISAALAYKAGGAKLAVWPIVGMAGVAGYMWWLYNRALTRAQAGGMSVGAQQPAQQPPPAYSY